MLVTVQSVLPCLEKNDLILVVFDGKGHITPTRESIWTVIVAARETGCRVVAGTVHLQRKTKNVVRFIHSLVQSE